MVINNDDNKNNGNKNQQESKQAQQMQTITKIMPLFMGFISWGFPMGLVMYFAVSNLFRVGQQAVIFRMDGGGDGSGSKAVKGGEVLPPAPPTNGPSPNASKKRNRRRRK